MAAVLSTCALPTSGSSDTVPPSVQLHTHLNFCVGLDQFSLIMSNASGSFLPNSESKGEDVHGQTNSHIQTGWVVAADPLRGFCGKPCDELFLIPPALRCRPQRVTSQLPGSPVFLSGSKTGPAASPTGGETLPLAPSALSSHDLSHHPGQRLSWLGWLWFRRAAAGFRHHCDRMRTHTPALHVLVAFISKIFSSFTKHKQVFICSAHTRIHTSPLRSQHNP